MQNSWNGKNKPMPNLWLGTQSLIWKNTSNRFFPIIPVAKLPWKPSTSDCFIPLLNHPKINLSLIKVLHLNNLGENFPTTFQVFSLKILQLILSHHLAVGSCGRIFSSVGKSLGVSNVTLPVAAHSDPRAR